MFVKPKDGLKILRPDTRTVLLESGEHVPKTSFWLRRLKDGDVVEATLAAPKKEFKPKKKKIEEVKEVKEKQTQLEVE